MAQSGAAGGRITVGAGTNLIGIHSTDRNQDASCYIGNLDVQATEEILWELCVQAGPVGMCCIYCACFCTLTSIIVRRVDHHTPHSFNIQSTFTSPKTVLPTKVRDTAL